VVALLVAGLAWAAGALYARYGSLHPSALMAAAQEMIAGGLVLLALAVGRGEVAPVSLTASGVAAFGYLTVAGSLVAFSAYGWLVKVTTPSRLSTSAYVNPAVAVVLGWAILGETLSARALAGAALIICAVVAMTAPLPGRASR
jgi:drug/metabolite transporter (DMT)-like permease